MYLESQKLRVVPDRECRAPGQRFRDRGRLGAAEALQPIETAATVRVRNGQVSVTDGPFAETKELVAGFWIIKTASKQEAIDWISRAPFDAGAEVEIRQVFEVEDFPSDILPPEEAAKETALREKLERVAAARK